MTFGHNDNDMLNGTFLGVYRALVALAECNEVLVHITDTSRLFEEVCMIIVEIAQYRLAWIGVAESDKRRTVRPVASYGYEDHYLEVVDISWADTETGQGPTGTAIRTQRPSVCQNIVSDPSFEPWREQALERGYASSVAIPIFVEGRVYGALNVYAPEADAFDEDELSLLVKLAANLSYGLQVIQTRRGELDAKEELEMMTQRAVLYLDILSHDMANQLQAMLFGASVLRQETTDFESISMLEDLINSADKLGRMISKARYFEEMETAQLVDTQLLPLVRNCVNSFCESYENVKVECEFHISDSLVKADLFLNQAFLNILENAVVHNPGPQKHIWVRLEETDDGYEIIIEDNGPGMPDSKKADLFDMSRRYSGIGLHMTHQIVEKHGGTIEVYDRVSHDSSQGTRVLIWIPKFEEYHREKGNSRNS
ncbi:MAG: GAF domain-containing sensor histidine kinase [Candidatus Thorarchaeota archaeon]|jgi:signal transduction histidine kinase